MITLYRLLVTLCVPTVAMTQVPSGSIDRVRRGAIDSTAAVLRTQYVSEDTARLIGQYILGRHLEGAYAGLTDSAFSAAVTKDLRVVNGDLHLSFGIPRTGALPLAGVAATRPTFIAKAEVLDGNIGLLEINAMVRPTPASISELRDAVERLANVSVLIVDVRRNRGGAAPMNDTLWTYFVADSQRTAIVYTRASGTTVERFARPRPKGRTFTSIPVFVLTSQQTASAAEGFGFFLQQSGRARVVGSRTAGAGHIVAGFQVGGGFVASISVARVRNPLTGKEWERTGVTPDVDVAPDAALTTALELARRAISKPNPYTNFM